MMMWKITTAVVAGLMVVAFGFLSLGPVVADVHMAHMEQMITGAKTAADHDTLAAAYEKEAQEARQQRAEHQQMRDAYATIPVLKTKTGAVAHCDAIAKKYAQIAKDYEAMAQMHRDLAKAAK